MKEYHGECGQRGADYAIAADNKSQLPTPGTAGGWMSGLSDPAPSLGYEYQINTPAVPQFQGVLLPHCRRA